MRKNVASLRGAGVVVTAAAVALAASAGLADAADSIQGLAKRALFADKAGSLNGIQASRKAEPGKLVALDKKGKLPVGVAPRKLAPGETMTGVVGGAGLATTPKEVLGVSASFAVAVGKITDEQLGILGGGVELPECEGNPGAPTAPPGRLCIYPSIYGDVNNVTLNGEGALEALAYPIVDGKHGFRVEWQAAVPGYSSFYASWAYTAPDPNATTETPAE